MEASDSLSLPVPVPSLCLCRGAIEPVDNGTPEQSGASYYEPRSVRYGRAMEDRAGNGQRPPPKSTGMAAPEILGR